MTKSVCKISPKKIEVYANGHLNVKPCGVKYSEYEEVHCDKYTDRTCEYMMLKVISEQEEEYLKFKGEML